MRILTEQELRRAVDNTVRRTLAENSQDEGIGKWLLGGAAALLGMRFWPQIKNFFSGLSGDDGRQTMPQAPNMPPTSDGSGNTDSAYSLPNSSSSSAYSWPNSSSSDGQLEDWQKEWRHSKGQDSWQQDSLNQPPFKVPSQSRTDGQEQSQTRPSSDYKEYSDLDKVDAILSNPMALRQLSRDEIRLLFMYRMMLSNSSSGNNRSNNTPNGYARGHGARNTRTSSSRSRRTTTPTASGNGRYAPGHKVR